MKKDEVLKLLIADESQNDAEEFISLLRNSGYAVRATHIEDEDNLRDALDGKPYDLLLCSCALDSLSIEQAVQHVQTSKRDLPIIAIAAAHSAELPLATLQKGASNIVFKDDLEHMKLVITQESEHLHNRRRMRHLEKVLRETELRCSALLDSSRDSIAYVHEGMYIYANHAYLERFGYSALEEIEGMPLLDMIASDDQPKFKEILRNLTKKNHDMEDVTLTMLFSGTPQEVTLGFSAASIDGEPCTQIMIRDRASSRALEEQIDTLAKQDLVTGLFNRVHFQTLLESAITMKAADGGKGHGLLYMQIDNLVTINKTIGPAASDKVLTDTADLLRSELGDACVAARFMDDVLIAFMPDYTVHETVAVAEAVRKQREEQIIETGGRALASTCSIGAVMIGEQSGDMHQVLADAVNACEAARNTGGNQVHLHSAAAGESETDDTKVWQDRLEDAMAENRFHLVYMPVASLAGDMQIRYEVRLRLRDEHGKEHMPEDFIAQAERCGLANKIDRWVLDEIINTLAKRKDGSKKEQTLVFIKLSASTLSDKDFLPFLTKNLKKSGLPGKSLNFQVNESVVLTQLLEARSTFKGLKELGCGFTLDHFGMSQNPFQVIKHLPADYLKLDHSLILEMAQSEEVEERVKDIIENAHSMKKLVVAGYLENAATLASLWQHNVDLVQGNFLQAPSTEMNYNFSDTVM